MKILLNIAGCIALLLGLLGIFLPLLPTTPFLLLASACFMRGSKRMHDWMRNNSLFGRYLRDFEANRGIPLRAKIVALLLMWSSLLFSIWTVHPVPLKIMLAAIGVGVSIYLVRTKTLTNEPGA